jgi:glycosyltransferase involved in cell wall biosynthesis
MKVFFINNCLTHYYNLVLNRLAKETDLDLTVLVPRKVSRSVGEGVHLSRDGILFRVEELEETHHFFMYHSFCGLFSLLLRERPDVVIFNDYYLYTFLFNLPIVILVRLFNIGLVMKSIPFRVPKYDTAKTRAFSAPLMIDGTSTLLKIVRGIPGVLGTLRLCELALRRIAYRIPDAHVNYVDDAIDIYGSYGVPRERIFVTRNSPDTDALFSAREVACRLEPILPPSDFRVVHVGRLVAWKRVDLLLRAFSRLLISYPEAELIIIGKGPETSSLKSLAESLGVAPCVRFLGGVYDPVDLGRYLTSSAVYVLAGMGGLSINEAMCFGLPIVCSVCDGTEKFLVREGFNGCYFWDGDEDDLFRAVSYLFDHPDLRREMGRNSTAIIRDEVNIFTVISGYMKALHHVVRKVRK